MSDGQQRRNAGHWEGFDNTRKGGKPRCRDGPGEGPRVPGRARSLPWAHPSEFPFRDCMGWLLSALDALYKKYIPGRKSSWNQLPAGKENKIEPFLSLNQAADTERKRAWTSRSAFSPLGQGTEEARWDGAVVSAPPPAPPRPARWAALRAQTCPPLLRAPGESRPNLLGMHPVPPSAQKST